MLVTTIPTALDHGMGLLNHARVDKLLFDKGRVAGLVAVALNADTRHTSGTRITVRARHYILSGGAINTPALLLRSQVPDPHGRVGPRRCIDRKTVVWGKRVSVRVDHGVPRSINKKTTNYTQL